MPRGENKLASSKGGHRGWGNTPDRRARLAAAQSASPIGGLLYFARRRFGADVELDSLTEGQLLQIESDKKAWQVEQAEKGIAARKAKAAARRAAKKADTA